MKKIIVTGATSMIGAALIEEAVQNGVEVYAVIRKNTKRRARLLESRLLHIVESSLDSLETVNTIPDSCDVFYHFAWAGTAKEEREHPFVQEQNIRYTLDAVKLAAECGCTKFVGAGSQAEYGRVDGPVSAVTRFAPETSYGAAKYASGIFSRKLCEKYHMVHIWGRIFSVYGRYDNEGTLIDYVISQWLKGEKACLTSGNQMWDYLYEKDAGRIFYLLGRDIEKTSCYRIANGLARPLKEYMQILEKVLEDRNICVYNDIKETDVYGLQADTGNLWQELGFEPEISFEEGIRAVAESYRNGERKVISCVPEM